MSNLITKVALCSPSGKIGPVLLKALLAEGFEVTVVIRTSSAASFPASQKIRKVSDDYSHDELVEAFKGLDAVVLSLSFELLSQSKKFAQASLTAGCRWLIASTYGANLDDPKHALFPASIPHRQAVDDLIALQKGTEAWSWTSISCGPWADMAIAAGAWNINVKDKTAQLVDGGRNVFASSTRAQVALAAARVLRLQPDSAKNKSIYVASFEASMSEWLAAHQDVVGSDGWEVTDIPAEALLKQSQEQLATGNFFPGYMGTALVVCTGDGYDNRFSSFSTLANDELGLSKEDMLDVVREGLATPNPFA